MAFAEKAIQLAVTDTTLFTCPATKSGSVHGLVFSNNTASAVTISLKFFSQEIGLTTTICTSRAIPANSEFAWPKPINMNAGDAVIASASQADAVTALVSIYVAAGNAAASGFTTRGVYSAIATYAINDVVTLSGTSYVAVAPSTGSQPPSVNWMVLAEKGESGNQTLESLGAQEKLISGTNLRTVNGESLLGSDDLIITATGAGVDVINYDNRATLRELTPDADALILVESLGLFRFFTSSSELDDDETCFSAASGQWLLEAADPEYTLDILDDLSSYIKEEMEDLSVAIEQKIEKSKLLRGSFSMSLTSLAAITSSAFSATIAGAAVGDAVIVNPGNAFGTSATDQGSLSYIAYVSAPDTVTVSIRNASAASAAMTASTWDVLVVKTVS